MGLFSAKPKSEKKKSVNLFWPKIEDREQAEGHIKTAAGVCVFIACVSFGISILYKYGYVNMPLAKDSWYAAFLYAPLAYFIYDKSKMAAWFALVLYSLDQALALPQKGAGGLFMTILFICCFISAIRSFNFLEKNPPTNPLQQPEESKKAS